MADADRRFHETWLGMVQPIEGLVLSIPVLLDAQCAGRASPEVRERFAALLELRKDQPARISSLPAFLEGVLELTPDLFDAGTALPEDLTLDVREGGQLLRPTLALKRRRPTPTAETGTGADGSTPQSRAGAAYELLVWDLSQHPVLPFDRPETLTGAWEYPPAAKFDRLLRACRVPIGVLFNGEALRLIYAPHGESTGSITFSFAEMATVDGRPILDACTMLLSASRFFAVAEDVQLPALLRQSRLRQANVSNELAPQVLEALGLLLSGFEAAAERDRSQLLDDALNRGGDYLYEGLLTVLLRLVFLLFAEDRELLPTDHAHYRRFLSVHALFEELQEDHATHGETLSLRFGAWPRLVATFRAVYFGLRCGDLRMPPRRGQLFDPQRFAFLEGWGPDGKAPQDDPAAQSAVQVPTVDDGTIYRMLKALMYLDGQRLSYRSLVVEQIGSVYEALMGYHARRLPSAAVCVRLKKTRLWIAGAELADQKPAARGAWLRDEHGLEKADVKKVEEALKTARGEEACVAALEPLQVRRAARLPAGRLVLEPGLERRRTTAHYTPRSLTAPIVKRTLEPLLAAMGEAPTAAQILELKICDPAMGSGAFLVETCRFLGEQLVAAWTREGQVAQTGSAKEDAFVRARRVVAQRCLYGVDKNPLAVQLAKISLWLETLAKDEPLTFLDHALRHGDSLVGLDRTQIAAFDRTPGPQLGLFEQKLKACVEGALAKRTEILALADRPGSNVVLEREWLLAEAEEKLAKPRLLADLLVGAFFSTANDKERKKERARRLDLASAWLDSDGPPPKELVEAQAEIRKLVPAFHWQIEFPSVFEKRGGMSAFVGNLPFSGGVRIAEMAGPFYLPWLLSAHDGAHGNGDYSAHFLRRCFHLLGSEGTLGLIATNTIAQGDTREMGLLWLVRAGALIYDATRSMPWPGDSSVAIAVVHIAKGKQIGRTAAKTIRVDNRLAPTINTRLRPTSERVDPVPLSANRALIYSGSKIYGQGFILSAAERQDLIQSSARNADRILPYLGGEELNRNPQQRFDRYVISFGAMSLEESEHWPDLLAIVREKVKPERERLKDTSDGRRLRTKWWQFGRDRPELAAALLKMKRCLVCSIVTKHLCFSWQPTEQVFSHNLQILPVDSSSYLTILQSRIHELWARLLSSTLETRLHYNGSDSFETFSLCSIETRTDGGALDRLGDRLDAERATFMGDAFGLTECYNRLKDPTNHDPKIAALRKLHEDVDRAVLDAYGWSDIEVPPFLPPQTPKEQTAFERFEDQVLDRLFALNAERAEQEKLEGHTKPKKGRKHLEPPPPKGERIKPIGRHKPAA